MPEPISIENRSRVKAEPQVGRSAAMRQEVIKHLGRPDDLDRVDVIRLYDDNHYRVNVYRVIRGARTPVGPPLPARKLTDSFFVEVVADGLVFSPPIERKYHRDAIEKCPIATP